MQKKNGATGGSHRLIGSHPHWWLGGMLLALHAALAWGIDTLYARAMLLAHFGIFLLWQPVWRGERGLEPRHAVVVVVAGVLLAGWNNWWLMAVWLAVLFSLIGGNLIGSDQRRQRVAAMLAALYLLSMLLIWVVPHLFAEQRFDGVQVALVRWGLPLLPLAMIAVPAGGGARRSPLTVDFFYSVLLFLLVTGLVLGSFAIRQLSHGDYWLALAQTLMVMAALLIALSWLWNPRGGFLGLGHLMSSYLMSLGLPFERWVKGLADLAGREREPARFLSLALADLCALPWVSGVRWQAPGGGGELGRRSRFQTACAFGGVSLEFSTTWSPSPALLLHLKLLTQMVGYFHDAKLREEAQRRNAYTQAIHETGARLTHDVKNLLQSLHSLCAAVEGGGNSGDEAAALQSLVRRQLPQITQRLATTLEKLRAPGRADGARIEAAAWWRALRQRYNRSEIAFEESGPLAGLALPGELFDSVAENLLQNALVKAQHDAAVRITVRLCADGALLVSDTGAAVPPAVVQTLLATPVASHNGLGVGLYQAARQAAQLGYRLELVDNAAGRVTFRLAAAGALTAGAAP